MMMLNLLLMFLTIIQLTEACTRAQYDAHVSEFSTLRSSVRGEISTFKQMDAKFSTKLDNLTGQLENLRNHSRELRSELQVQVLI